MNFSDVLKALGLYPGIKDSVVPLGIEASGVVTAVGEDVDRFQVGDEVFGVAPYAFASHTRTAQYALVHKPATIGHDEACTVPITFLTAYYGLVRLAQLQPGERVLIHAGAGGVGLAAIQIAQQIGAEVFATAGSDAKREILRSLGVKHVYSSRSTAFAEEILADTNREGVDVVLNSLPGEAITKSLAVLRAYGRFLEIGKTDIYQNRMLGLLPFQDNLSYFAIDLDRMLRQRPDYIRELFAEVMQHFAVGDYRPLAFTRFEADQTVDAFRYMSQRKNVGKVVVSIESRESRVESREPNESSIPEKKVRSDGAYLVTGGTGALGLRVAGWLAEQGAGAIALLSRRGSTADVEQSLDTIREKGSQVFVLRGDVADAESLAGALAQLPARLPTVARGCSCGRRVGGRHHERDDARTVGSGDGAKGQRSVESSRRHNRFAARFLRDVFIGCQRAWFAGPGELRGRQCVFGCVGARCAVGKVCRRLQSIGGRGPVPVWLRRPVEMHRSNRAEWR